MKTSETGIELIKEHEGLRLNWYKDQAGIPTIGYGHVILPHENHLYDGITEAQATELLLADLAEAETAVNNSINVPLAQNQFDALVSLVFNIGGGAFRNSDVRKKINSQASPEEIEKEWKEWRLVTIDGKKVISRGLVKRRADEVEYYFNPTWYRAKKKGAHPVSSAFNCPYCGNDIKVSKHS
jgi:lysozyme